MPNVIYLQVPYTKWWFTWTMHPESHEHMVSPESKHRLPRCSQVLTSSLILSYTCLHLHLHLQLAYTSSVFLIFPALPPLIVAIQGTQYISKSPLPLINEHSFLNSWLAFASGFSPLTIHTASRLICQKQWFWQVTPLVLNSGQLPEA